ncbi:MAG: YidB family protein [Xanthobacteraceae bacterium]
MSRGFPSMTALLGLLAIAGYQHRDKLAELLRNAQAKSGAPGAGGSPGDRGAQGGLDGVLGKLGGLLGGTSAGGLLGGGLRDLVENLKSNGQGEVADSWVRTGPNKPISPQELEAAISPEVWASLSEQTGLSRQELLSRLSRELPEAVDKYTPDGRLPAAA